jgi:hypothetical protein
LPRGHDPRGGRELRDSIDDEWFDRVAHGIDDRRLPLGVLAELPAERPEMEGELEGAGAIVAADRLVVRCDGDVAEAGGVEDAREARAVGERERAGCVRILRWREAGRNFKLRILDR